VALEPLPRNGTDYCDADDNAGLPYHGGNGGATPYMICTAAEMSQLIGTPGDWGSNFKIGDDIDMSGISGEHEPIGDNTTNYSGTFNGQAYTVANWIRSSNSPPIRAGVFGKLSASASLQAVTFVDAQINGVTDGTNMTGGLVGQMLAGATISNVNFHGTVSGASQYMGGLVGFAGGTISDSNANVTVTNTFGVGNKPTGGLVGQLQGGSIIDCAAKGTVTAASYTGGFVGSTAASPNIKNSYTSVDVTVNFSGTGNNIGGFIGYANGVTPLEYNTAAGDVTVSNTGAKAEVGGFIGASAGATASTGNMATGTVTNSSTGDNVGGFIGTNNATGATSYCIALGDVTAGANTVGGFIGANGTGTIDNSFALGDVTSTSGAVIGGFAGSNNAGGTINKSFAAGAVTASTSGYGYVADNNTGYLNDGFSTGDVTSSGSCGAIFDNIGTTSNLGYNTDASIGSCNTVSDENGSLGSGYFYNKNNNPMNVGGWDFTTVWYETPGQTNFPYLQK